MSKPRGFRRVGILGGGAVIVAAFGLLLYGGIEENLVYYLTPSELAERGESAIDAPLRLGGAVKPGSVRWDAEALHLAFDLTDGDAEVKVHSSGAPPQMFRDGMEVVVEGRLGPDAVFQSHNLMVMHSNEYYPDADARMPALLHEVEEGGDRLPAGHPTLR